MARYYLLTRARSPSGPIFPGSVLDDLQDPGVAALIASGARTFPHPDAVVGEAAARCEDLRRRGGSAEQAEAVMLEAAARAQAGGSALVGAPSVGVSVTEVVGPPAVTGYAPGTYFPEAFELQASGVVVVADNGGAGASFDLVYLDAADVPHAVHSVVTGVLAAGERAVLANSGLTIPADSVLAIDMGTYASGDPSGYTVYLLGSPAA